MSGETRIGNYLGLKHVHSETCDTMQCQCNIGNNHMSFSSLLISLNPSVMQLGTLHCVLVSPWLGYAANLILHGCTKCKWIVINSAVLEVACNMAQCEKTIINCFYFMFKVAISPLMFSPGIGGGGEARSIRLAWASWDPLKGDSPSPPFRLLGGERFGVGVPLSPVEVWEDDAEEPATLWTVEPELLSALVFCFYA